jgi:hypothetical protein
LVTGCCAEPSLFITQIFTVKFVFGVSLPSSARPDVKAILLPSLAQGIATWLGLPPITTAAGPMAVRPVRCTGDVPSAFMTHTFDVKFVLALSLPSRARVERNAILLPSGEMEGRRLAAFVRLVSGVWFKGKTVGSMDQMLGMPPASPVRAALML